MLVLIVRLIARKRKNGPYPSYVHQHGRRNSIRPRPTRTFACILLPAVNECFTAGLTILTIHPKGLPGDFPRRDSGRPFPVLCCVNATKPVVVAR